ncbi:hypothetical protein [Burkholderia sp. BCC1977]|uniref:hypothetical protein n=1 Tax=Burkholderia sp. BCC1977 TaxID=2817440 RepID=UPI002ABD4F31|nr:hypothetical protein [Burkholderia sp. BCC1977]
MKTRARLDRAHEIASLRKLLRQRALTDAAGAQALRDAGRERESRAVAARDAHFAAWRAAVGTAGQLVPALLTNFAGAIAGLAAECDTARAQQIQRQAALDACLQQLTQHDRLAELANEQVAAAEGQYRRALDERRMAEREIRSTATMEDR